MLGLLDEDECECEGSIFAVLMVIKGYLLMNNVSTRYIITAYMTKRMNNTNNNRSSMESSINVNAIYSI